MSVHPPCSSSTPAPPLQLQIFGVAVGLAKVQFRIQFAISTMLHAHEIAKRRRERERWRGEDIERGIRERERREQQEGGRKSSEKKAQGESIQTI